MITIKITSWEREITTYLLVETANFEDDLLRIMEGGSNVDGDESGGTSPSRQGAEIGTSGPPTLAGNGGGDRKLFWKKRLDIQGFYVPRDFIGQGGPKGTPHLAMRPGGGSRYMAAPSGHLADWWAPSS